MGQAKQMTRVGNAQECWCPGESEETDWWVWSWQTQIQWLLVLVPRQESKAPGPEIEPQLAGLGRDGTARSASCLGIAVPVVECPVATRGRHLL